MDCWASTLGDCASGQSGEHLISDGIFDGEVITAFGLPWCKDQPKSIGLASAVANILCRHHNSALSQYDAEAGRLSRFLSKNVIEEPLVSTRISLNGVLLEKWPLKTLTNRGYIGALDPHNHAQLLPRRDIIECLFRGASMPDGMGLYFISGSIGSDDFATGLSWQVINNQVNRDVLGVTFSLSEIRFIVNLFPIRAEEKIASMGIVNGVDYTNSKTYYRPANIILDSRTAGKKSVLLDW